MNPQMMQFGNQPGGYSQPGNYSSNYPPGGGPPPPVGNPGLGNYPPTQFPPTAQQKNLAMPPTTGAGFIVPPTTEGPLNGPPGHPPMQNPGPLNGPPGSQMPYPPQNSGPPQMPPPPQNAGPPPMQNAGPPPMQNSGPHQMPHLPQSAGQPLIPNSGPQIPQSLQSASQPPILNSGQQMPHSLQTPSQPPISNSGPPQMPHPSQNSGPPQIPHLSQNAGPHLPPTSGPLNGPPISQSSAPMTRPPGPLGPPTSQGMSINGPPGSQMLANQSQFHGGPPGPSVNTSNPQGVHQHFGSPQINGSSPGMPAQNMMPPLPGQTDPNRQYVNGTPQDQLPGGPPPSSQRPPYGPPGQMTGSSMKPSYPRVSSMSQPNLPMPPYPQQQQQQQLQQQQMRSPYSPPLGPMGKDSYQSGPPTSLPNEMRPGYPPMNQGPYQQMNQPYSGLNQNYGGGMTSPSYPQAPTQHSAQRKLDPDILPNPIQVMLDNEKTRGGIFYTDQKGLMPPLVTTNFVTQDQGNCSPRFLRATTYNVPVTTDLLKQTSVPFALLISPMARLAEGEQPPPIVNMGDLGPVRCVRCKAYMSPFMQFIDGGRRFHCVFCKATSEVPAEYFQHLDHTGQRVDRFERPELILGAYEFIATKDYCRNNQISEPPAFIFVIDVSYNNVKSGLVHLLCAKMKEIIKNLPRDEGLEVSNMKVGFITYSTSVHFYNIKSCLAAPQMMLVGDVNEMFMPLLDGFLCDPTESEAVIDLLMQEIPKQFAETRETETILYPAIQAGLEALKAAGCAGKLLVFHSSLPIGEAPGKLKNRDDRKMLNTEKEKAVLAPQNNSYTTLGQECVEAGCSVDLFIFNNSYVDLATIGEVSRLTGGEIFKYTYFQADIDGDRFIADLKRDVSRQIAFDAIMRVRTSTGVRPTEFYGHFYMSNTKDMELASIDSDKAVGVEIKHDDKLTEEDGVYIQAALLYTSCGGQRRLRILNLALKTCSQMADLYRTCDLDTLINYISKQGIYKLLETSPKQIKTNIMNRCANILACYRKNCANPISTGQLILPECIKLLPLYINSLLKSDAFSGGSDMTCDDRSFVMRTVMIMDLTVSVVYFYPRLIALHKIDPDSLDPPTPIRCTYEKLEEDGVYLLDNGIHMFMWLALNASTSFVSNVFGVPTAPQVNTDKPALPALENPLSLKIRKLIDDVREKRHRAMRLTIVKQGDKMELVFKQYLMEDHGNDGSPSYSDFLCHMHNQIRTILS